MTDSKTTELKRTPLFFLHEKLGAKMVPFAGYDMPVQYPMGVLKEHLWTREHAGLFDVSHMGQVWVDGPDWDTIARAFERLVPQDVLGLKPGRQRYGFFTNGKGGIEDDLMFARSAEGDRLFVVVNAACKDADIARMKAALEPELQVTPIDDRVLIAIQGPQAAEVCEAISPAMASVRFMDSHALAFLGTTVMASRSGYTGEDGFEISIQESCAVEVVEQLLSDDRVAPIGLGARDSLRLEAGLCLYGSDLDAGTTPVEADLTWAIQKPRRSGGERAGGFPGADRVLDQIEAGAPRTRVGLLPDGRAPMRAGVEIFAEPGGAMPIGRVTSGAFGPSIERPMSMAYVETPHSAVGTTVYGEVRGKRMPATVTAMPFRPAGYKR